MTPEQIEAYVDAAAAALQLPLAAAHRPGVLHYFALAANLADSLDADALLITDDPAETFLPVEPVKLMLPLVPVVPVGPADPISPAEPTKPIKPAMPSAPIGARTNRPGTEPS